MEIETVPLVLDMDARKRDRKKKRKEREQVKNGVSDEKRRKRDI